MASAQRSPHALGQPAPAGPRAALARGAVLALIGALLFFVATQGRTLWTEWRALRRDVDLARSNVAVGYVNISPNPSYARRPDNWFHDEEGATVLWSGWRHGVGHGWFRVGRGELARQQVSLPMGRDVIQAIDLPLVEGRDGVIWRRIPEKAKVVGQELAGVATAYPLRVLLKVEVVNDVIESRPFLIYCNPLRPEDESVAIYDPVLDGRRVTLGHTGYLFLGRPMLYDRGTESFWVADDDAIRAIAGPRKGDRLRRISRPRPVAWSRWRSDHPDCRLVVGADRSRRLPTL